MTALCKLNRPDIGGYDNYGDIYIYNIYIYIYTYTIYIDIQYISPYYIYIFSLKCFVRVSSTSYVIWLVKDNKIQGCNLNNKIIIWKIKTILSKFNEEKRTNN